jgi:tripartite-type tricarboxylate transporter receptor subunit TctC
MPRKIPANCGGAQWDSAPWDILGEHIDIAFLGVTGGLISSGAHLRALVTFEKERIKEFPNIPTVTELGYPISVESLLGLQVPKGTPKPIVDKLARAYREVLEANKAALSDALKKMDMSYEYSGPDESDKKIRESYEYFSRLAPYVLKK